ncbi:hypothetical protein CEP52_011236 [Fusarium oligoseptatum]|uniref:Uncharacterized protein n=1 Tax=Fusarium oligoseptatum TaxID=2604345 RepID=A0A428T496_9HYPO|nr:hypothetical protein CEP52_011236 [Fusarium oligoseptatum]
MKRKERVASQRASELMRHTALRFAPVLDGSNGLQDDSDSEFEVQPSPASSDNDQDETRPAKQPKFDPKTRGEPREISCAACINRMLACGPEFLCRCRDTPMATSCYGCAQGRRKCYQVPQAALPHARTLQQAAVHILNGEQILNWDRLALEAKKAVIQAEKNPRFVPNPPRAIDQGAAPSPEPSQSPPSQPSPSQTPSSEIPPSQTPPSQTPPPQAQSPLPPFVISTLPVDDIAAAIARNNELVAKTNQLLRRVLGEIGAFTKGVSPPPWD